MNERHSLFVGTREVYFVPGPALAEVTIPLAGAVLPKGVRIEEGSLWGAQKQEAWMSGQALQLGDLEFDRAFVVLGATAASQVTPALRAILLAQRGSLQDAVLSAETLTLTLPRRGLHLKIVSAVAIAAQLEACLYNR